MIYKFFPGISWYVPKTSGTTLFVHTKHLVHWYAGTVPACTRCSRPIMTRNITVSTTSYAALSSLSSFARVFGYDIIRRKAARRQEVTSRWSRRHVRPANRPVVVPSTQTISNVGFTSVFWRICSAAWWRFRVNPYVYRTRWVSGLFFRVKVDADTPDATKVRREASLKNLAETIRRLPALERQKYGPRFSKVVRSIIPARTLQLTFNNKSCVN